MLCKQMIQRLFFIFIFIFININILFAEEYFLTLRNNTANLRQGPSFDYPVKIFYKKKYLPVLLLDSSDNFRKIKDHENNTGWIHVSQLSKKKAALTYVDQVTIFKKSTIFSTPLAVLEKGRLCLISKCSDEWCKIKTDNYSGWVKKKSLWGNFN
jgi:SH3-like domain-containing protein